MQGTEVFTSKNLFVHPLYHGITMDYDYALIEMNGDSNFPLAKLNAKELDIAVSSAPKAIIAGWGVTSTNSSRISKILNKVALPLVPTSVCNSPAANNGQITDRMICAGFVQGGRDSCQSDSGGPLLLQSRDGELIQIGIVSWGEGCGTPKKFGVYSKVSLILNWIKSEINQ
jgi:secreted trypsin-like serine protease